MARDLSVPETSSVSRDFAAQLRAFTAREGALVRWRDRFLLAVLLVVFPATLGSEWLLQDRLPEGTWETLEWFSWSGLFLWFLTVVGLDGIRARVTAKFRAELRSARAPHLPLLPGESVSGLTCSYSGPDGVRLRALRSPWWKRTLVLFVLPAVVVGGAWVDLRAEGLGRISIVVLAVLPIHLFWARPRIWKWVHSLRLERPGAPDASVTIEIAHLLRPTRTVVLGQGQASLLSCGPVNASLAALQLKLDGADEAATRILTFPADGVGDWRARRLLQTIRHGLAAR